VRHGLAVVAATTALLVLAPGLQATRSVVHPRFAYDRGRPLELRLGQTQTSNGVVRQRLTFDAGRGPKTG